jgi:hypothetical protein
VDNDVKEFNAFVMKQIPAIILDKEKINHRINLVRWSAVEI